MKKTNSHSLESLEDKLEVRKSLRHPGWSAIVGDFESAPGCIQTARCCDRRLRALDALLTEELSSRGRLDRR